MIHIFKTYDVYSLGIVLLEVGLWEPLSRVARGLKIKDQSIRELQSKNNRDLAQSIFRVVDNILLQLKQDYVGQGGSSSQGNELSFN